MKKTILFALLAGGAFAAKIESGNYFPGSRIQVMAHNAYPDHGKYEDRLDRALASGVPFAVEEDLAWIDGKSLLIHGSKNASASDPTLESYFFPKIRPVMEKALQQGNKGEWPLITLYLDVKNDPPEHLASISQTLDKYSAWLTTAKKNAEITTVSPLQLKPLMVLVEDKNGDDNKRLEFYESVSVGGPIRVFGSASKPDPNPGRKLPKQDAINRMADVDPEQIVSAKADNYHRWWGSDWAYIERGSEQNAGTWTPEESKRLQHWVNYGHRLGYLVSFYCLDGFTDSNNQGWEAEYNVGSKDAVTTRWKALAQAKTDFISTDQYEELASFLRNAR
jgi:hypothetical protein